MEVEDPEVGFYPRTTVALITRFRSEERLYRELARLVAFPLSGVSADRKSDHPRHRLENSSGVIGKLPAWLFDERANVFLVLWSTPREASESKEVFIRLPVFFLSPRSSSRSSRLPIIIAFLSQPEYDSKIDATRFARVERPFNLLKAKFLREISVPPPIRSF